MAWVRSGVRVLVVLGEPEVFLYAWVCVGECLANPQPCVDNAFWGVRYGLQAPCGGLHVASPCVTVGD